MIEQEIARTVLASFSAVLSMGCAGRHELISTEASLLSRDRAQLQQRLDMMGLESRSVVHGFVYSANRELKGNLVMKVDEGGKAIARLWSSRPDGLQKILVSSDAVDWGQEVSMPRRQAEFLGDVLMVVCKLASKRDRDDWETEDGADYVCLCTGSEALFFGDAEGEADIMIFAESRRSE